jgi:phage tail protein X
MPRTAAQARANLADRGLNPSLSVASAVGTNTGGVRVHLDLVFQGQTVNAEDIYDALAAKFGGTAASLTTALAGANNDLVFTARGSGTLDETTTIRYVDPAANNQTLSVAVVGRAITVNLATGAGGAITSTGATVRDAINGSAAASALVFAANAAANDGTGLVTAMAATPLASSGGKVVSDKDVLARNALQFRILP